MKMVVNLDLNKLQIQNPVLHPLASAPGTPVTGQMYYDTALGAPRWYDGSAFTNKATDSALLGGSSLASVLNRANHTGTQLAATISDFGTAVQATRLDQLTAPTAAVNLNGQKITNLATPTNSGDAATMGYVDSAVQSAAAGIDSKPSVRAASTANVTISAPGTAIDGVTLANGDRVLLKNQTTASQNGVYVFNGSGSPLTRAADADQNNELTPGAFWFVEEGTTNAKTQWRIENTGTITVGTTAITINQFGAAAGYTQGNGITITGNSIAVNAVAGGGISVAAGGVSVDTAVVVRKYASDIGDGTSTTITVTHNLGTQDVTVSVREKATNAMVTADVVANGVNTVQITFASAPAANSYRVVVHA
jgi:hypothetical protein